MRRLVNVWLALLGGFWLTRAVVSWLLFGRVDSGRGALLELAAVPLLQALAVFWTTRRRPRREERARDLPPAGGEEPLDSGPPPAYKRRSPPGRQETS